MAAGNRLEGRRHGVRRGTGTTAAVLRVALSVSKDDPSTVLRVVLSLSKDDEAGVNSRSEHTPGLRRHGGRGLARRNHAQGAFRERAGDRERAVKQTPARNRIETGADDLQEVLSKIGE